MQRLIEFAGNHPYLVSAAVLMLIVVIVAEMRARIQDFAAISPHDAVRLMNHGALVLDVRSAGEYQAGHIGQARNIARDELAGNVDILKKHKEKPVITYCETGMSGGAAARELGRLGFTKVFSLRGGLSAWRRDNLPLVRTGKKGDGKPGGSA